MGLEVFATTEISSGGSGGGEVSGINVHECDREEE